MSFKCKTCDVEFETRKEMATHVYHEHTIKTKEPYKFAIPLDKIKDVQYLGKGCFAQVKCEGYITNRGLEVEQFTLMHSN